MTLREIDFGRAPEAMFASLCERPGAFFLDSAQSCGGSGRYSFIGVDPFLVFAARDNKITLTSVEGVESLTGDPLAELKRLWRKHGGDAAVGPLPFAGGAVGCFSYECGARMEQVRTAKPDDFGVPDAWFGFYHGALVFDAVERRMFVATASDGNGGEAILDRIEQTMRGAMKHAPDFCEPEAVEPRATMSPAEYFSAIARIKTYIAAGDVYQVNLTQRFVAPLRGHPYALYRRLRRRSPAPFASYLNGGAFQLVGSSPERFLRIENGRVETRPIKGTRPRGKTPAEDAGLREELFRSEKDRAELLMIVDLERNDLGRVCEHGSIRVEELFKIETHPTVHHLVATVSGRLGMDRDVFDCLRATLPGGSITGAPKIRAMQIIDELEPVRRGVYTGATGYIGFDGNCDFNIAIRTIVCAGNRACYHVGGGIVWDSNPEAEYQETLDKGAAMRAALCDDNP